MRNHHTACERPLRLFPIHQCSQLNSERSSMIKSTEASDRLHAQDAELCLIIAVWKTSNFRQERNSLFVLQKWSREVWAIIGFNETIRNWHEERYFTSFSRGIGIQFSTSNNTTSLNDHWLVYRHCAKLRKWYWAEKCPSSYKQATSLSPNQSASYMHLFSSTRKAPKQIGINENRLKCKRSKPTWFCRPSTELQRNREQRFKGWCHLPWLSDVEIRTSLPKFSWMNSSGERD